MTTGSVTCETCRHFLSGRGPNIGTCKRYPPTVLLGGQALPGVGPFDWCGEHTPRPAMAAPGGLGGGARQTVEICVATVPVPPKRKR